MIILSKKIKKNRERSDKKTMIAKIYQNQIVLNFVSEVVS